MSCQHLDIHRIKAANGCLRPREAGKALRHRDGRGVLRTSWLFLAAMLTLAACGRSQISVPKELGGLKLSEVTRGKKAAELINALHRAPVLGERHVVASYEGEGQVTLYVSRFASEEEARSMFDRMGQKLVSNPSPFGHYRSVKRRGMSMHSVTGLGQLHYTFVHGRSVYWLAGDLPVADPAVNDLLAALRSAT